MQNRHCIDGWDPTIYPFEQWFKIFAKILLYYYILKWTTGQEVSPWVGNATIFQYSEPNFLNPVGVLPCQRLLYGVGNYQSDKGNELVCGCAENAYVSRWGICTCMPGYSGKDFNKKIFGGKF